MICFKLIIKHIQSHARTQIHTHTENITVLFTLKFVTETRYVLHNLVLRVGGVTGGGAVTEAL